MKRRARISGEKLILTYLGRVTEAGLSYLPKGSRAAFVGRIKAQIERECGPVGLADAARVREVLTALGDPEELVRQERARLDAAWIKSTIGDRNLAQAAAAAINTPRKYRSITSRWKPATDTQSLPGLIDAKSMSAPIGKMSDEGDPFASGKQPPDASPAATTGQSPPAEPAQQPLDAAGQAAETARGPHERPAGPAGQASRSAAAGPDPGGPSRYAPEPVPGPSAQSPSQDSSPAGPSSGEGSSLAGRSSGEGLSPAGQAPSPAGQPPGAGSSLAGRAPSAGSSPAGQSPGAGLGPAGQATGPGGQASGPLGGPSDAAPGAAGTARGTSRPGPAGPDGQAESVQSLSVVRLASNVARFTTGRLIPRVVQISLTVATLAREHVREAVAVVLLGIGGLILPDPLWLVGSLVALMSRLWDKRDKWVAFVGPPLIALLGSGVTAAINGGSENAVVVYIDALKADIGLFLRLGCLLSAAYLAWRVYRGPRKKLPPWSRYG